MVEAQVKGVYGTSLSLDDEGLTVRAKKGLGRAALGADERRIPFSDITDRSFKPASMMINGLIEVVTANGRTALHFTGREGRDAKVAFDLIVELTPDAGSETAGSGFTTSNGVEGRILPPAIDPAVKAEEAEAKAVAKLNAVASKATQKAERVEAKQEVRQAKELAWRERAAEILASYGAQTARRPFGGSVVEIYEKGFVRVGSFISDSTPFEELRGISYSRTVRDKSAGGRALASAMTMGVSKLASNERLDTYLSIATNLRSHALKDTGRGSESAGLALEAAGKGVLNLLSAQTVVPPAPSFAPAASDPTEQLMKLAQLHAQGILSDEEFAKAKAKALGI